MKSQAQSEFVSAAIGLAIALVFVSVWLQGYCRRSKLKGSHAHPLALSAYYGFSAAVVLSAILEDVRELPESF